MLARRTKAVFYAAAAPALALNGKRLRWMDRARDGARRVHLGPGRRNYLAGWINCDANAFARIDRWVDLRNPLPFSDGTVAAVYSHHVVEHLPALPKHFAEVARILRSGGVYRVAGPDTDMAIARYQAGDADWLGSFPDARRSLGGKLDNFLLCRGEHIALLTASYLRELLEDAGFVAINQVRARATGHPELFADVFALEDDPQPHPPTLVMEAVKA